VLSKATTSILSVAAFGYQPFGTREDKW